MTSSNVSHLFSPDPKSGPPVQNGQVQVDLSNMIGRIKPKPVCLDETLKKESMSAEDISKHVFVVEKAPIDAEASVVSSGSSTASSLDAATTTTKSEACAAFAHSDFSHRKGESERINLKVKTQTISRNGRQTQRWSTDPATNTLYRMTTGCIPVLKNGKVLFCSASRKPEWILPKGGWEKDEAMEESAIRETFEEAGVFGIIGPTLTEIVFETRKGKKRRIEFEEVQRKAKLIREASSSSPKVISPTKEAMASPKTATLQNRVVSTSEVCPDTKKLTEATLQNLQDPQPVKLVHHSSDGDNVSVASETSLSHAHVKMSLFPLYVTEVMEKWPEQGRFRKVVDIDEAIRLSEKRPYFQDALKELKKRNLHISKELSETSNSTVAANDKET
eukprot:CAMPEP_0197271352 /NCGR_PEP_ID=MMETSP1432-20130617/8426_1 /TAXON_ID=44447 /ORGANISM="Pseudo-nitzschia delicatissima, Strain UNC1205" /LENGTH=389 /DNA_ID=CAMNT_0042736763 /DNA_START=81 /DNA_END=1250 /DNA_ORIENTATION=+